MKLTSATGNNASGIMDSNEFGAGKQFFNIQFNGPLAIMPPGTGPNTLVATTTFPPSTTFNFTAYAWIQIMCFSSVWIVAGSSRFRRATTLMARNRDTEPCGWLRRLRGVTNQNEAEEFERDKTLTRVFRSRDQLSE